MITGFFVNILNNNDGVREFNTIFFSTLFLSQINQLIILIILTHTCDWKNLVNLAYERVYVGMETRPPAII